MAQGFREDSGGLSTQKPGLATQRSIMAGRFASVGGASNAANSFDGGINAVVLRRFPPHAVEQLRRRHTDPVRKSNPVNNVR